MDALQNVVEKRLKKSHGSRTEIFDILQDVLKLCLVRVGNDLE